MIRTYFRTPKLMRLFKKIPISVTLLLAFSCSVAAQIIVSDTKLMQLKGQVKSVVTTSDSVSGYAESVSKENIKDQTTEFFDRDGRLTETIHEQGSISKLVYSQIDGYKTFKSIELKAPREPRPLTASRANEKPIEPNEKLTAPDERFDFKYVYETDDRGRVTAERQYLNTGKLFRKRTFEYDSAGVLIKETEEDSVARMKYSYKYDDRGNVVEVNKTRDIKGPGSDSTERIVYTDFKFDAVGNWTQRKTTNHNKTDPLPLFNIPAKTYTLVSVGFRTITYY